MPIYKFEDSSSIQELEYKPDKFELHVTWKSGEKGFYVSVDATIMTRLLNAESKGKFIAEHIKSNPKKYVYFKKIRHNDDGSSISVVRPSETKESKTKSNIVPQTNIFDLADESTALVRESASFHQKLKASG